MKTKSFTAARRGLARIFRLETANPLRISNFLPAKTIGVALGALLYDDCRYTRAKAIFSDSPKKFRIPIGLANRRRKGEFYLRYCFGILRDVE
jgi:hypothetical protein